MRLTAILVVLVLATGFVHAQEKFFIHKNDKKTLGAPIVKTDSIYFDATGKTAFFSVNGSVTAFDVLGIDSISFGAATDTVKIDFSDNGATVFNPFAFEGIEVTTENNDVTVRSAIETTDINYKITGNVTDGLLKIYSEKRFNLLLSGANIANADGPAINIQSSKKVSVFVADGTSNVLTDGASYAASDEDQKSAFFSEGQLNFYGTGSLSVKSNSKHGICSDDYINIENGNITVSAAAKDGIHAGEYFKMSSGKLTVAANGDGIDCENGYVEISGGTINTVNATADTRGIVSDSCITILGGEINVTVSGNQSKGLKSGKEMTLKGGTIAINNSGGVVLETSGSGFDPSYCSAIKADSVLVIDGSALTIKSTGVAGKGISSDRAIQILSGNVQISTTGNGSTYKNSTGVTDAYNATCISGDENILIADGTVTISSSGSGGKGISADGSVTLGQTNTQLKLNITTTGAEFIISGSGQNASAAEPKAISADGDVIVNAGNITVSSNDDGLKSETNVIINNGNLIVSKSYEAIEAPNISINGGYVDVTSSNDAINATKGTVNGGTESNDGSTLSITGGTLIASCTNGDAIDGNGNITMSGGLVIANGPSSNMEEAVDFNGTFTMNGGIFIGAGAKNNMNKAMSSSSKQPNMFLTTNSSVSSSTFIDIRIGSADVVTFKPKYGAAAFLISTPEMTKGASYTIYTGGSYSTSTNTGGYYTGGTYTPGTSKKTGTLSGTGTVNSISF